MGIVSQWRIYIVKFWTRVHRSDQFSSFSCSFRQILAFRIGAPSLENSGSAAVSGLFGYVSASCTFVSQVPDPFVGRFLIQ